MGPKNLNVLVQTKKGTHNRKISGGFSEAEVEEVGHLELGPWTLDLGRREV